MYNGIYADLDRREKDLGSESDIVYPSVIADLDRREEDLGEETDSAYFPRQIFPFRIVLRDASFA